MDKEKILLGASANIDTIKAHINRLKRPGYKIHILDIDMLKSKAYELYDQILTLEEITENKSTISTVKSPEREPETVISEKPLQTIKVESQPPEENKVEAPLMEKKESVEEAPVYQESSAKKIEAETIETDSAKVEFDDVKIEDVSEPKAIPEPDMEEKAAPQNIETETSLTPEAETKEALPQKHENTTTYDLFSGSAEKPIADRLTKTEETSIADKMQKSHIANIREAIGINDKFLFINELFNGDMSRYNKILDDINSMTTKRGIDTFLLELKIQSQWANDNEAYLRFKEIIERKF